VSDRLWCWLVSLSLIGAVLYPLQTRPPRDGYPLSTYPMFTIKHPQLVDIDHVVGVGPERSAPLPPDVVASGEVLQARVVVVKSLRSGRRGAEALCTEVAARVAREPDLDWVERVEVRRDRFVVAGYFSSARQPTQTNMHARCKVAR
jgi:hypothetical protein